jgi:transcriptional regulator with XRE-family HTH domain
VVIAESPGGEHQGPDLPQPSPRHNTTNMGAMEEALAAIKSLGEGEKLTYTKIAERYGVNRSTLSRRHRGVQRSMEEYAINLQLLTPHQEEELVKYIIKSTERGLPPTKEMIQNFARGVVKKEVGEGWFLRFVERHKDALITKWTAGMDRNRHQADSEHKYSLYFNLLESKISEHSVLPENSYNMDEKGFMIGRTGRSKRVFSKALWESKQVTDSLQDGNREWVSVLACIGADGTALLPSIIFDVRG